MMEYWNIGFRCEENFPYPLFHYSSIPIFRQLSSWMITLVNLLQSLSCDMGIYLSGGNIHVTKHHLNRTEIRPPFQKMACEGVTEKMGGNSFPNTRPPTIGFDIFPALFSAHP